MAPIKNPAQDPKVDPVYLLTELVKLQTQMQPLADAVLKLEEINEGTINRKGLKEKIAQAEQNIEANKSAYLKLEGRIGEFEKAVNTTIQEAFTEVSKKFNEKIDQVITDTKTNKTALDKMQPYFNVISWIVITGGGIIFGLLLTGKWQIIIP